MPFPGSIDILREAESKLGATLPLSYRSWITKQNGGELDVANEHWFMFPVRDASDRKRLARTCNDIVHETEVMRDWPNFPKGAVTIASNGGGDHLVFLRDVADSSQFSPHAHGWWHDSGEVVKIADDLDELRDQPD